MPCRCCGASRPSKGFTEPGEQEIYVFLRLASDKILEKENDPAYEDIDQWKKGWQEAFDHMLNGCNGETL